jgi:hypothetical protein
LPRQFIPAIAWARERISPFAGFLLEKKETRMGTPDDYGKGPVHGSAAAGISAAYDRDRNRAEAELQATIAGPRDRPAVDNDPEVKNPDGEWENPAPMTASRRRDPQPPGPVTASGSETVGDQPNQAGNSKGDGTIDPQGQQGGTHGGSAARPSLGPAEIDGPLETPDERKRRSTELPS